jgi:hypothetical protein
VSVPAALERICGIQDQYAPNGYLRLWSCLEGFERADLTRALERRRVVQATLFRGTIHLVSARDYRPFITAIRGPRRIWASRIHKGAGADRRALVSRIHRAFRGRAFERAELEATRRGASDAAWQTVDTDAELLRLPPSGTWEKRRAHTYGLASDWLGDEKPIDPDAALVRVVSRYLGAFGPAAVPDIALFAGLPLEAVRRALAGMRLRRFRDERGRELLDLPRAPLPAADTPAPVRFLPTWDAILLVHARRAAVLDEAYRKIIFRTTAPGSFPTFLVDGRVAGAWRFESGRVLLEPFERLSRSARRELAEEGERLAAFHA